MKEQGLDDIVVERLGLKCSEPDLSDWKRIVDKIKNPKYCLTIALVGKYVELQDAYLSVGESLRHAGIYHESKINIKWVYSADLTPENLGEYLCGVDGILVPGGFGDRGIEGKILAAQYARENKIPFLGICLGMQLAVVEFSRFVANLEGANSSEFDENTPYPVIDLLPEQKRVEHKGGTMRLGAYPCRLVKDSKAYQAFQKDQVWERHRHRYEFNNDYREVLTAKGMKISGTSPDGRLVEIVELIDHPWFVGCQFHPEFKSRPDRPHPLFREFVGASLKRKLK